jgi:hypothetical protein
MTVASVEVASCGFAVVPAGFSGETMDHLIRGCRPSERPSPPGRNSIRDEGCCRGGGEEVALTEIAGDVLGSNALPFRATLFDESCQSNWLVVWHQDPALPLREKPETAGGPGQSKMASTTRVPGLCLAPGGCTEGPSR